MGLKFIVAFLFFAVAIIGGIAQQNKEWIGLGVIGLVVIYAIKLLANRSGGRS